MNSLQSILWLVVINLFNLGYCTCIYDNVKNNFDRDLRVSFFHITLTHHTFKFASQKSFKYCKPLVITLSDRPLFRVQRAHIKLCIPQIHKTDYPLYLALSLFKKSNQFQSSIVGKQWIRRDFCETTNIRKTINTIVRRAYAHLDHSIRVHTRNLAKRDRSSAFWDPMLKNDGNDKMNMPRIRAFD